MFEQRCLFSHYHRHAVKVRVRLKRANKSIKAINYSSNKPSYQQNKNFLENIYCRLVFYGHIVRGNNGGCHACGYADIKVETFGDQLTALIIACIDVFGLIFCYFSMLFSKCNDYVAGYCWRKLVWCCLYWII